MESNYFSWTNAQAFPRLVFFYQPENMYQIKEKNENEYMEVPCLTLHTTNEWKVLYLYLLSSKVPIST